MLLQEDRKAKQAYLREEILNKNYDPEEFIIFLNEKLNIDSDLDRCELEQLKNVVSLFIEEKESNIIENVGSLASSQTIIHRKSMQRHSSVLFKEFNPPVVEQEFETTHKCIKFIPKFTADQIKRVYCEVTNPERKYVGGLLGIGATSFLEFEVTTHGLGWKVGRRYSDFIWLRNALKKYFPSQIIPPIPNKKASKRTVRHIEKRMRILTYFLNDLAKLPEIFNSKYVEAFLSQKENSKFESLKKEADNKMVFESIASTETESGFVKISLSNDNVVYCRELKKFVDKSEVLYKQITRSSKRFQAQKIDEVNQLYEMGNKFAELYEAGKVFETATKSPSICRLNQIYIKLNNMMIEWGNNIKNEIQLLEINFNTFFKYARESYMGYKEYFERTDQLEKSYLGLKSQLDVRKQKIFLLHDPNRWDVPKKDIPFIPKSSIHERTEAFKIMLPKESIEVQKQKINYSFYLSRLLDNSTDYFQKQVQKFNENFKQFAIKNKVNNQQMGQNWNQMCAIFSQSNLGMGKKLKQMQKIVHINDRGSEVYDD